jgi:hypothetical protein
MLKGLKFDLDQTVEQLGLEDKTPFIESERHATLQQLMMARSGIYIRSGNDQQDKLSPKRGSSYPGVRAQSEFQAREICAVRSSPLRRRSHNDGIAQLTGTENNFAMAAGGGIDFKLSRHVSVRPIQAEYFMTKIPDGLNNRQDNLRIGAGIVLRLGQK